MVADMCKHSPWNRWMVVILVTRWKLGLSRRGKRPRRLETDAMLEDGLPCHCVLPEDELHQSAKAKGQQARHGQGQGPRQRSGGKHRLSEAATGLKCG